MCVIRRISGRNQNLGSTVQLPQGITNVNISDSMPWVQWQVGGNKKLEEEVFATLGTRHISDE